MNVSHNGPGHVSTDEQTLLDLLQLIERGKAKAAASLVRSVLQAQRRHDAKRRRQIADMVRDEAARKAAAVVATAEEIAADLEGRR